MKWSKVLIAFAFPLCLMLACEPPVGNDPDPVAAASANPSSVTAAGTTVTLSSEGSTGSSFGWAKVSGPDCTITDAAKAAASFIPPVSGTYVIRLTVKNSAGKEATKDVTVTASFLSTQTAAGIDKLKTKDFVGARADLAVAVAANPQDHGAAVWLSLLDSTSLSTSPDIVSLMKDNLGVESYPSDLNTALGNSWFSAEWYAAKGEMVADANGEFVRGTFTADQTATTSFTVFSGLYDSSFFKTDFNLRSKGTFTPDAAGIQYVKADGAFADGLQRYTPRGTLADLTKPVLLPDLGTPPAWASSMFATLGGKSIANYPVLLFCNLIENNPLGLNAIIDNVLSGAFGTAFDDLYDRIQAIPDTAEILVPNELITAYAGSELPAEFVIKIGVPELKAFAVQMKMIKVFFTMLSSYNFTYPLGTSFKVDWSVTTDTDDDDIPDVMENFFNTAQNPVEAGFLSNRSQTVRTAAKADLVTALQDLSHAAGLMTAEYCSKYNQFGDPAASPTLAEIISANIATGKAECDKVITALTTNSSYSYTVTAGPPAGPSGGPSGAPQSITFTVNPNPVFDTPFFSLTNLFETTTTGFVIRGTTDTYTDKDSNTATNEDAGHTPVMTNLAAAFDPAVHVWPALELKLSVIESVYPDAATMLPALSGPFVIADQKLYYMPGRNILYLAPDTNGKIYPDLNSDGTWKPDPAMPMTPINWLTGVN